MYNRILIPFLSFIILFFYSKLYFTNILIILDTRDEVGYLIDSLLLLEGMRPSFSHSPTGISTWFGSFFVLFHFLINIISDFSITITNLFNIFDRTLFFHYQNLTYIKSSLFALNIIFLIYFFKKNKNSSFFLLFLLSQLSPLLLNLSLSGKPYFLSQILLAISLIFKNEKNKFSIIFFALASSERLENIVLLPYFIDFKKKLLNNLSLFLIVFASVSPWFTMAFLQNIKVLVTWILANQNNSDLLSTYKFFIIFLYILLIIIFTKIDKKLFKNIIFLILILFLIINFFINIIPFRWTIPSITFIIFYISIFIDKRFNNKNLSIILTLIFLLILSFLLTFHTKSISDKSITSSYNTSFVFEPMMLIENATFDLFLKYQNDITSKTNIKNIRYFNTDKAPLAFGESGNLEKLFFRRYEYINKYQNSSKKDVQKFITGESGLFMNKKEWCKLLKSEKIINC